MAVFTDDVLMAFADEELDPMARVEVEVAMRDDPDIRRRVAQHRALRARVRLAYSADLQEAPPERLLAAANNVATKTRATTLASNAGANSRGRASVTRLSDARAAAAASGASAARAVDAARATRAAQGVRWRPVASIAASLVIGVAVGYGVLRQSSSNVAEDGGGLVAGGALAKALSGQLGGERPAMASVQLGLSFLSRAGDYCRVFTLTGGAAPSGVACQRDAQWRIQVLAQPAPGSPAAGTDNYRTAGSAMSPAVLGVVQEQINGEPLDAAAEAQARQRGWQAPGR